MVANYWNLTPPEQVPREPDGREHGGPRKGAGKDYQVDPGGASGWEISLQQMPEISTMRHRLGDDSWG
jgi:hypothetical protein